MTANEWRLILRCIEEGVRYGVNRAYKHSDAPPPTEDQIERIQDAVANEISEWFTFPPAPDAAA